MSQDDDVVEIQGVVKHETARAILLDTGDEEVWIPKSQVLGQEEIEDGITELQIPEWLAMDKGLI